KVYRATLLGLLVSSAIAGCSRMPQFPVRAVRPGAQRLAFDINGDGRDDYWQDIGSDGRKTTLRFDDDGDGHGDTVVQIDGPPPADGLHVVIVLDGVPFEIIRQLYDSGRFRLFGFRLFGPPSRLISVFPALTDPALARAFQAGPCLGYEALYYDVNRNRLSRGDDVYLSSRNAPWTPAMDYRCGTNWDVLTYLDPAAVWRHEIDGFTRTITQAKRGTIRLYTVATAGLATRGGAEAIRTYLQTVDALCEQVTHQRRGNVRFTLLADHGHGLTACKRISFSRTLRAAGLRVARSIRDESDVVMPAYGLVTCAAIHTRSPTRVADAVLQHEATDLVMYRATRPLGRSSGSEGVRFDADTAAPIVVRSPTAHAEIQRRGDRFIYKSISGDPLELLPILDSLADNGKVARDGSVADRDLFDATATHEYPDALHRIWCALQPGCLVENAADVIVSLKEGYACGSKFFSALVNVESTHGAMSGRSSTTFVMSNAMPLPAHLRVDDLGALLGVPQTQAAPAARR
ncbi:MAG: hypothetical protein ACYSUI_10365, partial [Planctomycetota bacterium]